MRSMQWQLGILGTISAFAFRHRETKKNLCRGGRSQDLTNTDFQPAVWHLKQKQQYTHSTVCKWDDWSVSPVSVQPHRINANHTHTHARTHKTVGIDMWFPTFFHLPTPWQPISINCTLYISSSTRRNVQLISQILTCILSYTVDVCACFRYYSIFFFAYP